MRNMRVRAVLVFAIGAVVFFASPSGWAGDDPPPGEQTLQLTMVGGGGLGETLTMTVSGTPFDRYWIIISLTEGPWDLPSGWLPDRISVGPDLAGFSASIPGFVGDLGASGSISLPLPIPNDPILDSLVLNTQVLDFPPAGPPSIGASNQYRVTFQQPHTFVGVIGGPMQAKRSGLTATLLDDGTVLLAGGSENDIIDPYGLPSGEIYRPDKERFDPIVSVMPDGRTWHTATKLLDGTVLLAGGGNHLTGDPLTSADIYDPVTQLFTPTGVMHDPRVWQAATLLDDGRVFICGGSTSLNGWDTMITALDTSEIYDPATGTFTRGPTMSEPKTNHTVTRLADGKVLVAGGITWVSVFGIPVPQFSSVAQLYDPVTNSFGPELAMSGERFAHTATLMPDGTVFLIGGAGGYISSPTATTSVEVFDPVTQLFYELSPGLNEPRAMHQTVLLDGGQLVVLGGGDGGFLDPVPTASAEIWDPVLAQWDYLPDMTVSRLLMRALRLDDRTVVILGGAGGTEKLPLQTAEIFQP